MKYLIIYCLTDKSLVEVHNEIWQKYTPSDFRFEVKHEPFFKMK